MDASTSLPRYVWIAGGTGSGAGNAGDVLQDFLGILAFHFEKAGAAWSAEAVGEALAALPALMPVSAGTSQEGAVGPSEDATAAIATELARLADAPSTATQWQPLARQIQAPLRLPDDPTGTSSSQAHGVVRVPLLVLNRATATPSLGVFEVQVELDRSAQRVPGGTSTRAVTLKWNIALNRYQLNLSQIDSARELIRSLQAQKRISPPGERPPWLHLNPASPGERS